MKALTLLEKAEKNISNASCFWRKVSRFWQKHLQKPSFSASQAHRGS